MKFRLGSGMKSDLRSGNWVENPCYNIVTMAEKKKHPAGSEFWQIIFPTLAAAVLILALGVWLGLTASTGNISRFAEISTTLLAIPVYVAALIVGLVLAGLILLVGKLIQGIPMITSRVLDILSKIENGVRQGTRSLARVVIEPIAILAIFQRKRGRPDKEIKLTD